VHYIYIYLLSKSYTGYRNKWKSKKNEKNKHLTDADTIYRLSDTDIIEFGK